MKTSGPFQGVDLNGWTKVAETPPTDHKSVLLGYFSPGVPEVWYGIGKRDEYGRCYWIGPRGIAPHWTKIAPEQVIIWKEFATPFCFDMENPSARCDYMQHAWLADDGEGLSVKGTGEKP